MVNFSDIKPALSSTLISVLLGWDLLDSRACNVHCWEGVLDGQYLLDFLVCSVHCRPKSFRSAVHVYPILLHPDHSHQFHDQFAFRPTGSTTAAVIYLLHKLTELLHTNDYVHVMAFDFSKAFDRVRHHSLASELADFTLPDDLYNWIVNNLSDLKHHTNLGGNISPVGSCN